jgi:methylated-DNA-[protein]-cysteine S-methyltransferase
MLAIVPHSELMILSTPIGDVAFFTSAEHLVGVDLYPQFAISKSDNALTPLQQKIRTQVMEYFAGKRKQFEIPLKLTGSEFQHYLCSRLLKIPFGSRVTYGALAKELASSARAIGGACRRNPIPLIIPCHRVVAAHGIGGFSGATKGAKLEVKLKLLQLESEQHYESCVS